MNKRNETIQNLFDEYAETLEPRADLASKARIQMAANQAQPSASARKKSGLVHLAWIAPVAVVFVAIIAVIFTLPMFNWGGSIGEDTPQTAPTVVYYTFADVKGSKVSIEQYDDMLQLDRLARYGYQIVGSKCYAFFTSDRELRYLKVQLGVRSSSGTFTELDLIVEVDGYVRADLQEVYQANSRYNGINSHEGYDENGEYVTKAYFAARDMHFYVVAINGEPTRETLEILQLIYNK